MIRAGSFDYWRVEPRDWTGALRDLAALGLRQVDVRVPWRVHETADGRYDWSGARDLGRFVDRAVDAGLGVLLRPGPGLELPDRIGRDAELLARAAHGGPAWLPAGSRSIPLPSYGCARFRLEIGRWYAALGEVLAPRKASLAAIALDTDAMLGFRLGAYDLDYHPEVIAKFGGEPPRRWDPADAERCVAWVRWKEHLVLDAGDALDALLDDAGLDGVPRQPRLPPSADRHARRADLAALRRHALLEAGSHGARALVEIPVAVSPWLPALPHVDERIAALVALATGVPNLSLIGAAEPGASTAWIAPLCRALDRIDWPSLRRPIDVALVVSRADERFAIASSLLDPVTGVVTEALGLGPAGSAALGRDDDALRHRLWLAVCEQALDRARVRYVRVDESCPVALETVRAVVAPTLDRLDGALAAALRKVAERKGIVVIGPGTPSRDELGRPITVTPPRRAGTMRAGSLDDVDGLAADLAAVASPAPGTWELVRGREVELTPFAAGDEVRALFVAGRGAKPVRAELEVPAGTCLRDAFTDEILRSPDGGLMVPVEPRGVRLLLVD